MGGIGIVLFKIVITVLGFLVLWSMMHATKSFHKNFFKLRFNLHSIDFILQCTAQWLSIIGIILQPPLQIPEHFHHPLGKDPHPSAVLLNPSSLPAKGCGGIPSSFVFLDLSLLNISFKWNYTHYVFDETKFLCLDSFTQPEVSKTHPYWIMNQYFAPFLWLDNSPLWGYDIFCLYRTVNGQWGCFPLAVIMNHATVNTDVQALCGHVFDEC